MTTEADSFVEESVFFLLDYLNNIDINPSLLVRVNVILWAVRKREMM